MPTSETYRTLRICLPQCVRVDAPACENTEYWRHLCQRPSRSPMTIKIGSYRFCFSATYNFPLHAKITIVYQQNANGWITSSIPKYPGAVSQGKSREEARKMVLDALNELVRAARDNGPHSADGSDETLDFEVTVAKLVLGFRGPCRSRLK